MFEVSGSAEIGVPASNVWPLMRRLAPGRVVWDKDRGRRRTSERDGVVTTLDVEELDDMAGTSKITMVQAIDVSGFSLRYRALIEERFAHATIQRRVERLAKRIEAEWKIAPDYLEASGSVVLNIPPDHVWPLMERMADPSQGWSKLSGMRRSIEFPDYSGDMHRTTIAVDAEEALGPNRSRLTIVQGIDLSALSGKTAFNRPKSEVTRQLMTDEHEQEETERYARDLEQEYAKGLE